MKPPVPYRGNEPYIFISYAHKDSRHVWPVIAQLQADGYRVWYDEGIDPGTEWDENIASHVTGCQYFIAFLSKNYINSENCKDELNFSRDIGKKQLLIYLEDVDLPDGMDLRFGRCQTLHKNGKGNFYQRLYDSEGISAFTSGIPGKTSAKKFNPLLVLLPLAAIAAAAALFFMKPSAPPETTTAALPAETTTAVPDPDAPPELGKRMIFNKNSVSLTVQDMYFDEEGAFTLEVMAKNDNTSDVEISLHNTYINCVRCEPYMSYTFPASSETIAKLRWRPDTFEKHGVGYITKPEDVTKIEASMQMEGFPDNHYFTYYPYGEELYTPLEYDVNEDIVIFDNEEFTSVITDHFYDETTNQWTAYVVSHNKSDRQVNGVVSVNYTNGYRYGFHLSDDLRPGSVVRSPLYLDEWQATGFDEVHQLDIDYHVQDVATSDMFISESVTIYPEGDTDFVPEMRVLDADDEILVKNDDVVIAITDKYTNVNDVPIYYIYGRNLHDTAIDVRIENFKYGDEDLVEFYQSLFYLAPGEQGVDFMFFYNYEDHQDKIPADFEVVVYSNDGNAELELCRQKVHMDIVW